MTCGQTCRTFSILLLVFLWLEVVGKCMFSGCCDLMTCWHDLEHTCLARTGHEGFMMGYEGYINPKC